MLLLTSVAFTIAMAGRLPILPYVTYISLHFNVAIGTMFLVAMLHAIEAAIGVSTVMDLALHGALFALWAGYHAWLGWLASTLRRRAMRHGPTMRSIYDERRARS